MQTKDRCTVDKDKGGRPSKYKEEYCELLLTFFDIDVKYKNKKEVATAKGAVTITEEEACELPMFVDFAHHIGVHVDTLHEWCKVHAKFSEAYKKAKKLQERIIAKNAIKGRYNTTFALFALKCNHGWNDKAAEQDDKDFSVNVNIVDFDKDKHAND